MVLYQQAEVHPKRGLNTQIWGPSLRYSESWSGEVPASPFSQTSKGRMYSLMYLSWRIRGYSFEWPALLISSRFLFKNVCVEQPQAVDSGHGLNETAMQPAGTYKLQSSNTGPLGSRPTGLSRFSLDKLCISPAVCQVKQTHAHGMSPARRECQTHPAVSLPPRQPGRGDPTQATPPQTQQTRRGNRSSPGQPSEWETRECGEALGAEREQAGGEAASSRNPGLPSHSLTSRGDSAHSAAAH